MVCLANSGVTTEVKECRVWVACSSLIWAQIPGLDHQASRNDLGVDLKMVRIPSRSEKRTEHDDHDDETGSITEEDGELMINKY